MRRRAFLLGLAAAALALPAVASPLWPGPETIDFLGRELGDRLVPVEPTLDPSVLQNPFALEEQAAGTQSSGWLTAWSSQPPTVCIAVESAADVRLGVGFAGKHDLRLVVKGTGHDYLGRSNGDGGVLLWTHRLRKVWLHDWNGIPAVSAQAGARWLEVYTACQAAGRYAQGGGCTSVGAAGGFIQGSGFGSFSRRYGTGASGVLEFEVVTADGEVRVCNEREHADLFWALRGGGGGTFGVVLRVTLRTRELPTSAGLVTGRITSGDYPRLLRDFARFLPRLCDQHWGEVVTIGPDAVELGLTYVDLTEDQARAVWQPILTGNRVAADFEVKPMEPAHLWDPAWFERNWPGFITRGSGGQWWWSSNQEEVSAFIASYQSRWLPLALDAGDLFVEAVAHNRFHLHLNKALAGAHPEALARTRETCLHPAAYEAAALVIAAANQPYSPAGPDLEQAKGQAEGVEACMKLFRQATPGGGTYANEADYFEKDWQDAFWGPHYSRLLAIKRRYDPDNVFRVHHGVGSEDPR